MASGRLSKSLMPALEASSLWNLTAHLDSKKPLGLDSLAPR